MFRLSKEATDAFWRFTDKLSQKYIFTHFRPESFEQFLPEYDGTELLNTFRGAGKLQEFREKSPLHEYLISGSKSPS